MVSQSDVAYCARQRSIERAEAEQCRNTAAACEGADAEHWCELAVRHDHAADRWSEELAQTREQLAAQASETPSMAQSA